MTLDEAIEHVNQMISLRGYIVIGGSRLRPVGDTIEHWIHWGQVMIDHPLTVIAVTDREDMIEQLLAWGREPRLHNAAPYHYRCITD